MFYDIEISYTSVEDFKCSMHTASIAISMLPFRDKIFGVPMGVSVLTTCIQAPVHRRREG